MVLVELVGLSCHDVFACRGTNAPHVLRQLSHEDTSLVALRDLNCLKDILNSSCELVLPKLKPDIILRDIALDRDLNTHYLAPWLWVVETQAECLHLVILDDIVE